MTEDTTGKAILQEAALARTTAGIVAREQAGFNMTCVSAPIPFILLSCSWGWDTEKTSGSFSRRLLAKKMAGQETSQKPLSTHWRRQRGVRDIPPACC